MWRFYPIPSAIPVWKLPPYEFPFIRNEVSNMCREDRYDLTGHFTGFYMILVPSFSFFFQYGASGRLVLDPERRCLLPFRLKAETGPISERVCIEYTDDGHRKLRDPES
jgi:hypothetical protein